MARQVSLFPTEKVAFPPGFDLMEDVVTAADEAGLIAFAETLTFEPFVLMGQASLRDTAVFGADYSPESPRISDAPPMPEALWPLRDLVAVTFGEPREKYIQSVVTRYPPGSGIGWHADYKVFGPAVLGVALGGPCRFKLRPLEDPRSVVTIEMPPRSIYILRGPARSLWQHSIPAVRERRYSITFRTVRSVTTSPGA